MMMGLLLAPAAVAGQSCPDPVQLAAGFEGTLAHVRYLADDALVGRDPGSTGERCAGDYIASRFAEAGLEPAGDDSSWYQSFEVRTGSRLVDGNVAAFGGDANAVGTDWVPWGFSPSASASGPMILAEADDTPEDLRSTVAVIELLPAGLSASALQADAHFRASQLARRGAVGVIVLMPEGGDLPDLSTERRPAVPVPTIAVAARHAPSVRDAARRGESAAITTALEPATSTARNVVGMLPGSDSQRADEWVIVGAHYDHLGIGGEGSLEPEVRAIHNGADDNASGTAGLIEVARALASGARPQRPVLFIGFSGEERGLLGSAWFTDHPTVPLERAVAMLNMDMVGRLRDATLTVFGMATAPEWPTLLEAANVASAGEVESSRFTLALLPDGYGPSDHSEFYAEGIPVLHFFTNTHGEYHRPVDDWQTINAGGLDGIAEFVHDVTASLAGVGPSEPATLTPVEAQPPTPSDREGGGRGYGPYFGSIPDMAATVDYGVRLSGVRTDSPAERAGLRAGDVLVRFGDVEVTDLYAFTYALRDAKPGDQVELVVLREGVRYTFNAVLGEQR